MGAYIHYAIVISQDEEEDSGIDDLPNIKYPRYVSMRHFIPYNI